MLKRVKSTRHQPRVRMCCTLPCGVVRQAELAKEAAFLQLVDRLEGLTYGHPVVGRMQVEQIDALQLESMRIKVKENKLSKMRSSNCRASWSPFQKELINLPTYDYTVASYPQTKMRFRGLRMLHWTSYV